MSATIYAEPAEALRQLWRVVEAAPDDKRFNMWQFHLETGCGTARCAAGWFAVDGWARENTLISEFFHPSGELKPSCPGAALEKIFGLTSTNAKSLFYPDVTRRVGHVPKAAVLANIDRLLAGLHAIPYGEKS